MRTDRRPVRRSSMLASICFVVALMLGRVTSRIGLWRDLPWLQTDAPGPLTSNWWLRSIGTTLIAGLLFGYLLSRMLRFSHRSAGTAQS